MTRLFFFFLVEFMDLFSFVLVQFVENLLIFVDCKKHYIFSISSPSSILLLCGLPT